MKTTTAKTVKDLIEVLSLMDPEAVWDAWSDGCIYIVAPNQTEEECICSDMGEEEENL